MKKTMRIFVFAMVAIMLCLAFASCGGPNADPEKALDALKENGVKWATKDSTIQPAIYRAAGINGVETVVSGTGEIDGEFAHITILYFENSNYAKEEWEDILEYADEEKKDDVKDSEWVCKRSGKMIYFGTKNAIESAK